MNVINNKFNDNSLHAIVQKNDCEQRQRIVAFFFIKVIRRFIIYTYTYIYLITHLRFKVNPFNIFAKHIEYRGTYYKY